MDSVAGVDEQNVLFGFAYAVDDGFAAHYTPQVIAVRVDLRMSVVGVENHQLIRLRRLRASSHANGKKQCRRTFDEMIIHCVRLFAATIVEGHFVDTALMASALEIGIKKYLYTVESESRLDESTGENDNVGIVVSAGKTGQFGLPA